MFHYLYVGHFDPSDRVDTSEMPYQPKPVKPISEERVEDALAEFGDEIRADIAWAEHGYAVCCTSATDPGANRIADFAYFLAKRESAVVMDERYQIYWPAAAAEIKFVMDKSQPQ